MAYKIPKKKFKNRKKAKDGKSYFLGYEDGVNDYYNNLMKSGKRIGR
jgi:hypothetical protein